MRISTNQLFTQGTDAMLQQQYDVSRTQLQLASGERILQPSDDPAASVQIRDLSEAIDTLAQYNRNADAAVARLDQEENSLTSIVNLLQRIRELNIQGNNMSVGGPVVTEAAPSLGDVTVDYINIESPISQDYRLQHINDPNPPTDPLESWRLIDTAGAIANGPDVVPGGGNTGTITVAYDADPANNTFHDYQLDYDGTDWTLLNTSTGESTLLTFTGAPPTATATHDGMTITLTTAPAINDTYVITPPASSVVTPEQTPPAGIGGTGTESDPLVFITDAAAEEGLYISVDGNQVGDAYDLRAGVVSPEVAEDRRIMATEIREHLDGIRQLLNTRDASGEYIFAGFKTGTEPFTFDSSTNTFTYNGDQGQRLVQIGPDRKVAIGDPGADFFSNIETANILTTDPNEVTDLASIVESIADAFDSGRGIQHTLTDIDSAMSKIDRVRAKIGSRQNAIEEQRNSNAAVDESLQQSRSNLQDLDFAEAISRFNQQLLALQASQQSFARIQNLSLFNFL